MVEQLENEFELNETFGKKNLGLLGGVEMITQPFLKEHFFELFKLKFMTSLLMEKQGVHAGDADRFKKLNFAICHSIFMNHAVPFYKLGGNPTKGYADRLKGKEHECVQICNSTGESSASEGSQFADFCLYALNWINDAWRERTTDFPNGEYLEKLNQNWIDHISGSELV